MAEDAFDEYSFPDLWNWNLFVTFSYSYLN